MARAPDQQRRRGSPTGSLLLGVSFYALASYWPEITGTPPDAADQLYLGFFKVFGALAVLNGVSGYYKAWQQARKREEAAKPSGTFGDAAFGTPVECRQAGLSNPRGLFLGLLEGQPLFFDGKAHLITVAPARQGKGTSVVMGNALHFQGSLFVTDPKGEIAAVAGPAREEELEQRVFVLNPWGLHGLPQHRYNPLQRLTEIANDPELIRDIGDEVARLALILLSEPEDARNRYFREGSRAILRAVMLLLATRGQPELCALPEMWRIIASPRRLARAVEAMEESEALFGMLATLGDDLAAQMEDSPEQFADFRQGALQALDEFNPNGRLADCVSGSDFSFSEMKEGDLTIFQVLPNEKTTTHGKWLALNTSQAITDVARSKGNGEVLFMLDEFANMGKLEGLAESLTALPGLGVRVWMFVQELAEVVRIYGPNTAKTVLSQAEVKQFFAVQDDGLAKTLSAALGQRTVKTKNHNLGRFDDDEIGESLGETGRPLMAPDEIRQMGPREQLLFIGRLPPIRAERIPFWEVEPWASWARDNPVEGGTPRVNPTLRLRYSKRGTDDE